MKKQWIEALRSGKYKQGGGTLKQNNLYCCLGVLAQELNIITEDGVSLNEYGNAFSSGFIPASIIPQYLQITLSKMNDGGSTFKEIADYLEQKLSDDWKPNVL